MRVTLPSTGSILAGSLLGLLALAMCLFPAAVAAQTFGVNAVGGIAVSWTDYDGSVKAALRPKAGAAWGVVQRLSGPVSCSLTGFCAGANSIAISDKGQAVATWSVEDSTATSTSIEASTTN